MYPRLVECNVCGWQGKRFLSDAWHEHSQCPRCHSAVRHRLFIAALQHIDPFTFTQLIKDCSVLHFAPEQFIEQRLKSLASEYLTSDYLNARRDFQIDISDMQEIHDNNFDLLIACDVLEHVRDHHRAMREIHRVLRPGGYAILTVPQKDHLAKTYEDLSITAPDERERAFGQHDHLRIYGNDFPTMLEAARFSVTAVSERDFPEKLVERHVLFPPKLSANKLATNYRKVFFAQKA
jgi:SAM-dependent methyltransferase